MGNKHSASGATSSSTAARKGGVAAAAAAHHHAPALAAPPPQPLDPWAAHAGLYASDAKGWAEPYYAAAIVQLVGGGSVAPRLLGLDDPAPVVGATTECSLCLQYLPLWGLNRSRCCKEVLCSECFFHTQDAAHSLPCPYCRKPAFRVAYAGDAEPTPLLALVAGAKAAGAPLPCKPGDALAYLRDRALAASGGGGVAAGDAAAAAAPAAAVAGTPPKAAGGGAVGGSDSSGGGASSSTAAATAGSAAAARKPRALSEQYAVSGIPLASVAERDAIRCQVQTQEAVAQVLQRASMPARTPTPPTATPSTRPLRHHSHLRSSSARAVTVGGAADALGAPGGVAGRPSVALLLERVAAMMAADLAAAGVGGGSAHPHGAGHRVSSAPPAAHGGSGGSPGSGSGGSSTGALSPGSSNAERAAASALPPSPFHGGASPPPPGGGAAPGSALVGGGGAGGVGAPAAASTAAATAATAAAAAAVMDELSLDLEELMLREAIRESLRDVEAEAAALLVASTGVAAAAPAPAETSGGATSSRRLSAALPSATTDATAGGGDGTSGTDTAT